MLCLLLFYLIGFEHAILLFLRRISTVLSQGISHGMWLLASEFLLIKSVLHFAFLHFLNCCSYYDYVVICVLRPSWLLLLRLCSNRCAEALVAYRNSLLNRFNIVQGGKILTIMITRPFLLGPLHFQTVFCTFGPPSRVLVDYHLERGGMQLHDGVGVKCKNC